MSECQQANKKALSLFSENAGLYHCAWWMGIFLYFKISCNVLFTIMLKKCSRRISFLHSMVITSEASSEAYSEGPLKLQGEEIRSEVWMWISEILIQQSRTSQEAFCLLALRWLIQSIAQYSSILPLHSRDCSWFGFKWGVPNSITFSWAKLLLILTVLHLKKNRNLAHNSSSSVSHFTCWLLFHKPTLSRALGGQMNDILCL